MENWKNYAGSQSLTLWGHVGFPAITDDIQLKFLVKIFYDIFTFTLHIVLTVCLSAMIQKTLILLFKVCVISFEVCIFSIFIFVIATEHTAHLIRLSIP